MTTATDSSNSTSSVSDLEEALHGGQHQDEQMSLFEPLPSISTGIVNGNNNNNSNNNNFNGNDNNKKPNNKTSYKASALDTSNHPKFSTHASGAAMTTPEDEEALHHRSLLEAQRHLYCVWVNRWHSMAIKTPIFLLCVLFFFVVCGTSIAICVVVGNAKRDDIQQEALDLAIETGEWFSSQLDQSILPLFSLAQFTAHLDLFHVLPDKIGPAYQPGSLPMVAEGAFHRNVTGVCDDPELVSRFDSIASGVKKMANMDGILVNIQLAPYGVLCLLHPMNNTEDFEDGKFLDSTGAWGLDLFQDPNMKFIAGQSIKTDHVGVAGPLRLVQCPTCAPFFIARLPIVDETHSIEFDGEIYPRWGFATALIDWIKLVDRSGIYESFAASMFEFRLTRTDRNFNKDTELYEEKVVVLAESFGFNKSMPISGEDGEYYHDDSAPSLRHAGFVSTSLETTNNEWVMTVQYDNNPIFLWLTLVISGCVAMSFFVSYLVYTVLLQKQTHAEMTADTQAQQAMINTERNMTAYFAHELRNPLSALDNALRTLKAEQDAGDTAMSEETIELLEGMQLCSNFMSSIMNNLLDVRKIEEGKMTFRTAPVSLASLVDDSHRMMVAAVREGVEFKVVKDIPRSRSWVVADSHRIQQVLCNVLSNAIKYTLKGSITLIVSWRGRFVQFECVDTGPGIPKQEQEKLFERFVQRGGAPGTGLGLNIARQIVRMMNGTILFESDPTIRPGTTCRILLPLEIFQHSDEVGHGSSSSIMSFSALSSNGLDQKQKNQGTSTINNDKGEAAVAAAGGIPNEEVKPQQRSQQPKNPTAPAVQLIEEPISVLIMDDIKMNRNMLKRRLQKAVAPNADIVLVATGEEAMQVCMDRSFDIVICDQYMEEAGGVMLGTDTIIAMRREKMNSFIIGCSGNDLNEEFMSAGANLVWGKPMPSNDEIIKQWRNGLKRKNNNRR